MPTPTVGVVGLIPKLDFSPAGTFQQAGDLVAVAGVTRGELGASHYLYALHGKTAGTVPPLDLKAEGALQKVVRDLVRARVLASAHDCAEGGLAVALAECCIADRDLQLGATVRTEAAGVPAHAYLFGEDASRVVVSFAPEMRSRVEAAFSAAGVPLQVVGTVGGDALRIDGMLEVKVAALDHAFRTGLPAVLGQA